jgi:hypothetical protein
VAGGIASAGFAAGILPGNMELKAKNDRARRERVKGLLSKDPRQLALAMNLKALQPTLVFKKSDLFQAIKHLIKAHKGEHGGVKNAKASFVC